MKERILFVDDERFQQKYYISALQDDGFEVDLETDTLNALDVLVKHHAEYCCAIIDVMMFPGPPEWADLTNNGQFTGIELCVRAKDVIQSIPILLLSNKPPGEIKMRFARDLSDVKAAIVYDVRYKIETPSEDLPRCVRTLIARFEREKRRD